MLFAVGILQEVTKILPPFFHKVHETLVGYIHLTLR